jgi:hypothetical protein
MELAYLAKVKQLNYYIGPKSLLILLVVIIFTTGCEYEWKDEPPATDRVVILADNSEPARQQPAEAPKPIQQQQSDQRPVLAPGKDVSGQAALPAKVKRIDLLGLLESGGVQVSANVSGPDLSLAFDEREDTLAKSEGVNPYKLTFEFTNARTIKAIRVLSSYSDYSWAFQTEGGERLFVDTVIDGQWSTIAWPDGVKVQKFSIEVLRKHRDNFVHLNEVEVYE